MNNIEQVLLFSVADNLYCIDSSDVDQILRVPDVTQIPMAPQIVRGMSSVKGSMVTIIDTRFLLNKDKFIPMDSQKSRIITLNMDGVFIALLVEEIKSNVILDEENIEHKSGDTELVCGILNIGKNLVHLIDTEKLSSVINKYQFSQRDFSVSEKSSEATVIKNLETENFLVFKMGNEQFAIETDIVREIIVKKDCTTKIPESNENTLGLITLRDEVLVAIDFRKFFNIDGIESNENRFIILHHNEQSIALLVDSVIEIKDFEIKSFQAIPEKFKDRHITGVIEIEDELISIVDKKEVLKLVSSFDTSMVDESESEEEEDDFDTAEIEVISTGDEIEIVTFILSNEEYAFNIDAVEEIIRHTDITIVPQTSELIKGIINLRGQIIPVVSLHKRLNMKETISSDSKIIISKINSTKIGFIVDNITEIFEVSSNDIKHSENSSDTLFSEVVILENGNRIILKLDSEKLFKTHNFESLDLQEVDE
jgi:purine-binding chemotaxis protein CheW